MKHRFGYNWRQQVMGRNDIILCDDKRWFVTDPPGCKSDHFMLVATMQATKYAEHRAYLHGWKQVPLPIGHDFGPTEEVDRMLTDLQQHCVHSNADKHSTRLFIGYKVMTRNSKLLKLELRLKQRWNKTTLKRRLG
jgi:hypothetical protein